MACHPHIDYPAHSRIRQNRLVRRISDRVRTSSPEAPGELGYLDRLALTDSITLTTRSCNCAASPEAAPIGLKCAARI